MNELILGYVGWRDSLLTVLHYQILVPQRELANLTSKESDTPAQK
jgi:hypothetical protein